MSTLEKINLLLEKIDTMKAKIQQTINNPFLPESMKLRKIREMESSLKDAQAFALVFMSVVVEENSEETASVPLDNKFDQAS